MENAGYATLSRQSGLMREMQIVANNIANAATTGYRQEGLMFSEFIHSGPDQPSLSMSQARIRNTSMTQGALTQTNGAFDLAIEGEGFFLVETPAGERMTRAGNFSPNADGDLVNMNGHRVLDTGQTPIFIPPDATDVRVASDGTVSANGRPISQVGLFLPVDPLGISREDGVLFSSDAGFDPATDASIVHGFLEDSNVNAIAQVTRMIEIQRAYEMGQSFLQAEDERIRNAMKSLMP
ncbi:flagellar hook-basal body complex protein [Falsiphaeobacter marinintestinus]|uniref:flagellar hook-basal body complex protein n=1 Tax=Falsiphaeobacter marinintestinus TaxID=1492905 RepID=UPI0011B59586|nr:flagellar hook-basal body complex protein [Phaeobacter marinintestinus]